MSNLKKKAINGVKWNLIEQISVQGMRFLLGIVLARLLLPEAYGIIGLITVFLALSQTFVNSGFGVALIQKKDRNNVDYSTVFYFNLIVAILCWTGFTLARYKVAEFFDEPLLVKIIPIIGLNIIFTALSLVQITRLTVELNFKNQAKATFLSTLISGALGIYLAYRGFGVWSLVYQSICRTFVNTLILWISELWIPPLIFSLKSFKQLFSFGSKIMASGLLNTIYLNIYALIIGKLFSTAELGFYNRAKQFANLPSQNITSVLERVTFPILSSLQENNDDLLRALKKFMKMTIFLVMPLMLWLMVLARPIVLFTIKEKWEPSIILLQILCLVGITYPIQILNLSILKVKGHSDIYLKIEIIQKIITTITIFSTFFISVKAMVIGSLLSAILAIVINTHYTKKVIGYGLMSQIRDFAPTAVLSLVMVITIVGSTFLINGNLLKILIGSIAGLFTYIGLAYVFKMESFFLLKEVLKNMKK